MTLLVSDTGPIISLLLVNLFDIIEKLFPVFESIKNLDPHTEKVIKLMDFDKEKNIKE